MAELKGNEKLGGIIPDGNTNIFKRRTKNPTFNDGMNINKVDVDKVEEINYYPLESENTIPYPNENATSFIQSIDYFKRSVSDDNDFEDPTLLGFQLVFIKDTPLFSIPIGNDTTTNKYSAHRFLNSYSNISTLSQRKDILVNFVNTFNKFFRFDTDEGKPIKNKVYYISSIGGLDKLNEKIVDYKGYEGENKITITMNEDIMMSALYLSELYNNLVYDYKNQRSTIPENCIRFDMKIKVSEIRDFKLKNFEINKNVSSQVYILRDCNFNFTKSQNHGADLSMGGYAGKSAEITDLKFEIIYKSIERVLSPMLMNLDKGSKNPINNIYNKSSKINNNDESLSNSLIKGFDDINKNYTPIIPSKTEMNNMVPDPNSSNGTPYIMEKSLRDIEESISYPKGYLFSGDDSNVIEQYALDIAKYALNRSSQLAKLLIYNIADKYIDELIFGKSSEKVITTDLSDYVVYSDNPWTFVDTDLGQNRTILQGYAETAKNTAINIGLEQIKKQTGL